MDTKNESEVSKKKAVSGRDLGGVARRMAGQACGQLVAGRAVQGRRGKPGLHGRAQQEG